MFDRWQTLIASFDYINASFIFIIKACNYRFLLDKSNFSIRRKELCNRKIITYLLIDDGKSNRLLDKETETKMKKGWKMKDRWKIFHHHRPLINKEIPQYRWKMKDLFEVFIQERNVISKQPYTSKAELHSMPALSDCCPAGF